MPLDILSPKSAASDRATRLAQGDHPLEKAEQVAVLLKPIPVEPGHLVILVVRVVVAVLSVEELVAGTEHRGTVGQHQQTTKVFHLPAAQRQDVFQHAVVALPTAVPAQVVVCAVQVAVSIYLIVLVVISNQIVKAKPIMGGNKVNALIWAINIVRAVREKIVAAVQAPHERAHFIGIAFDKPAYIV